MHRLIEAGKNSWRAFGHLLRHEAAFRLEVILFVIALGPAYLLSGTWRGFSLLIVSIIILMIVEVLNTAVEEACNAITRETRIEIGLAKDCGSLAVALAAFIAIVVWLLALIDWLQGQPF